MNIPFWPKKKPAIESSSERQFVFDLADLFMKRGVTPKIAMQISEDIVKRYEKKLGEVY
jgi:hypothetical protein